MSLPEYGKSNNKLDAALDYGASGRRVIPLHSTNARGLCSCSKGTACSQPGKHPRYETGTLENGSKSATTDPEIIRGWWRRWPTANIGGVIPDDEVVIDIDRGRYGFGSFDELQHVHGELPETETTLTGRGGQQLRFKIPAGVRVNSGNDKFGLQGVDIKAAGSYVVLPPSITEGPYERQVSGPPVQLPTRWLEALSEPQRARSAAPRKDSGRVSLLRAEPGEIIAEGMRNSTLFFEALDGKDRGLDYAEVLAAVREANDTRCVDPLPDAEVDRIVSSAMRYPARRRSRETPPEVLAIIGELERLWWASSWRGVGGKTERDVLRVLITLAKRYGTLIPAGVRVSVSVRTLALAAATHYVTVSKVLKRLRTRMVLRKDDADRPDEHSGAVVLLDPRQGANTPGHPRSAGEEMPSSVSALSRPPVADLRTPCFRWRGHVGKGRAGVLYALEAFEELTADELAEVLGWSRTRDLRRKYLEPLESLGLIEISGSGYRLPDAESYAVVVEEVRAATVDRKVRRTSAEGRAVVLIVDGSSEHEREQADREKHEEQRRVREERRRQYRSPRPEPVHEEPRDISGLPEAKPAQADPADPELVRVLRANLDRFPRRSGEHASERAYASWLVGSLCAYGLLIGKPTPERIAAVELALAELVEVAA
jgi:hypothetical protein